jgi:hypothetical protein
VNLVDLAIAAEKLEKRVFQVNHLDAFIQVLDINCAYGWQQRFVLDAVKLLL